MKRVLLVIFLSIFFCLDLFASKNLYLSYTKTPNSVYKNQKFELKVKALITTESFSNFSTILINQTNVTILNTNAAWKKVANDTYENSFYLKAKSQNFRLPTIEVKLWSGNSLIDVSTLEANEIKYSNIGKSDDRFSGIIADNIILKAYKTKQYNNQEALTIIDIDSINSNLEDFKLENVVEQGVSNLKDWENIQNLVYYFVTPIYQKNFIFTYFNSSTNS